MTLSVLLTAALAARDLDVADVRVAPLSAGSYEEYPDEAGRRVYQHAEIEWGPFERRIRIATPVDPGAATVTYLQGLLKIALPLAARPVVARVLIGVRIP